MNFLKNSNSSSRKLLLDKVNGDVVETINIGGEKYDARKLIAIYSNKTLVSKNDLRESLSNNKRYGFDSRLVDSMINNFEFIGKYKERVNIAGELT